MAKKPQNEKFKQKSNNFKNVKCKSKLTALTCIAYVTYVMICYFNRFVWNANAFPRNTNVTIYLNWTINQILLNK